MSDTDSFINEVTEEVRQDQLFGYIRKYGWIAGLCVLALVGGTAFVEARKASARSSAQAFGDQVVAAMLNDDSAARVAELSAIEAPSAQADVILALLQSGEEVAVLGEGGEDQDSAAVTARAIAELQRIQSNPEAAQIYKDLASFKAAMLLEASVPAADRIAAFSVLNVAGGTFRLMAEEQVALIEAESGDVDAAIARFDSILEDAELTASLRQRVEQWKVVLGAPVATE